jgi:hypothetical protein
MEATAGLRRPEAPGVPTDIASTGRPFPGRVLRPAVVYLTGQAVVLVTVWIATVQVGASLGQVLQRWDARQLLAISEQGYPDSIEPGGLNSFAFFPAFPLAVRWLSDLTGLSLPVAGTVVSVASGIALAYAVDRCAGVVLGTDDHTRVRMVLMVATLPLSVVFLMPYTEAMFCALAAWALVLGAQDRWPAAGLLAAGAGLVRPTAGAVVLAVWVGAVLAWRAGRVTLGRALTAAVVAPLGVLAYLAYVAARTTGSITAWSESERKGWDTRFDYGALTWSWLKAMFLHGGSPMDGFIVAGAVAVLLTAGWLLRERLAPHVVAYVLATAVVALGSSGMWSSKFRFLLPALLVTAVLAAAASARARPSSRLVALIVWIGVGSWFSAFALVGYAYAI